MTAMPPLHYTDLIAEVDKTLSMIRSYWMEGRDAGEKSKHMTRINELLDQRLALMAKRDGVQTILPT